MDSINVFVQNLDQTETEIEIPLGVSMNLMEVLKGEGFPIEAVCGGMALCATCRVEVLNSDEVDLEDANDNELDMLESLPSCSDNSRLTCQLHISERLHNLRIKFPEEVYA